MPCSKAGCGWCTCERHSGLMGGKARTHVTRMHSWEDCSCTRAGCTEKFCAPAPSAPIWPQSKELLAESDRAWASVLNR